MEHEADPAPTRKATNWRRGILRLCLVLSTVASVAIAALPTIALWGSHPTPSLVGVAVGAAFAATFWLLYGLAVWVFVGFGVTPPLAARANIAVVVVLAAISAAALQQARRHAETAMEAARMEHLAAEEAQASALAAQQRDLAEKEAERQRLEADSATENQRLMDAKARAEAERRAEDEKNQAAAAARRQDEIDKVLRAYPAEAEDLAHDGFLVPSGPLKGMPATRMGPRHIGSQDQFRRSPETPREYLVDCAMMYVRRKCAAALVDDWPERSKAQTR